MKLSRLIRDLIRLGDASHAYWDKELPRHHPNYPVVRAGESSVPPPPEDAQIQTLLTSIPDDQLYAVALLTYMGKGDFSADHLRAEYQSLREILPSKDLAIAQIMSQKSLGEYLTDAMEEIEKRDIDLDSLDTANTMTVGSGK